MSHFRYRRVEFRECAKPLRIDHATEFVISHTRRGDDAVIVQLATAPLPNKEAADIRPALRQSETQPPYALVHLLLGNAEGRSKSRQRDGSATACIFDQCLQLIVNCPCIHVCRSTPTHTGNKD